MSDLNPNDLKSALVGTWKLVSFEVMRPGSAARPWGEGTHGILIYTAEGYVSLAVNRQFTGSMSDHKAIYDAMLFYAGRFEVKDPPRIVQYLTEASNPQKIGRVMERDVRVEGNRLIMDGWGDYGTSLFIWERF